MAAYRQQVAEGRSTAPQALEAVEQLDAERAEQAQRLADAEAVAAEHDTDADEAQTTALVSTFRERMAEADSAPALDDALAGSLAGMWATVVNGQLHVEFELADSPEPDVERVGYLLEHAVDDERGERGRTPG